jgi:hypothetical protein
VRRERGTALLYLAGAVLLVSAIGGIVYAVKGYLDGVDAKAYARGKLEGSQATERIWRQAMEAAHAAWEKENKTLRDTSARLGRELGAARAERDGLNEELIKRGEQHAVDRPPVCNLTPDELCDWNDAAAGHSGTCRPGEPARP